MHTTPLSRRRLVTALAGATAVAVAGCLGEDARSGGPSPDGADNHDYTSDDSSVAFMGEVPPLEEPIAASSATHFQESDCPCCAEYAPYLQSHLEGDLAVVPLDDADEQKASLGVPRDLWSCHTVALDGYAFEGHLPAEVIATYLEDDPDSWGIALPGMPAGAPGMGGQKDGTWTVYEFDEDGEYATFVEL